VNPTDVSWSGTLATDGGIVVAGKVGGIAGQSSPQHVSVIARDWQSKKTLKDHQIVSPSTLSPRPTGFEGQLGNTSLTLPVNVMSMNQWSATIADNGPNDGFRYLTDLPVTTTTRPQANTNALNATSDFYKIQETRQRTIKGVTYCAQSFVLGIIPLVQAHEGYDPDNQPNSHAGIYRRHVDSVSVRIFEAAVGPSTGDEVTPRANAVFNEASADAAAMDHDSRNNLTNLTVPCSFHYDYSGLK
jgi:hypothetical protein